MKLNNTQAPRISFNRMTYELGESWEFRLFKLFTNRDITHNFVLREKKHLHYLLICNFPFFKSEKQKSLDVENNNNN